MDISAEKVEEAREIVEEAADSVEKLAGERPEPRVVKFGGWYPKRRESPGIADPVDHGVYQDKIPYDIREDSTVLEHELTHLLHFKALLGNDFPEDYMEELRSELPELEGLVEEWGIKSILEGRGFGDEQAHLNSTNLYVLAAFNHEEIDSNELKNWIKELEELTVEEIYRHNQRYHADEIEHQENLDLKGEAEKLFAWAVSEKAENMLQEVERPEELDELAQRGETLSRKDFEVEIETNARMVEFMIDYRLNEKNPYEEELVEGELSDIGSRIEGAEEFYRYGDEIAEYLFESIETFYRLKEVYSQAGVEEPGQKAAQNIVQAGIERIENQN